MLLSAVWDSNELCSMPLAEPWRSIMMIFIPGWNQAVTWPSRRSLAVPRRHQSESAHSVASPRSTSLRQPEVES